MAQPTPPRQQAAQATPTLELTFHHLTTARRVTLTLPAGTSLSQASAEIWQALGLPLGDGAPQYVRNGTMLNQDTPLQNLVQDGADIEVYSAHEGAMS